MADKKKYLPDVEPIEIFPDMGIKGAGGKVAGIARKTGNIKSKEGIVIGSRIAKAGSLKALGIARPHMTKSDYSLKRAVKEVKKMPDKEFKHVNLETRTYKSDRTGKMVTVQKTDLVKGSVGKKNYIQEMKRYQRQNKPKYTG